ncbi:GNAT family N-acetyltransferase [Amycolatopsis nigrescens]|uniref:GNAT family N-acetyltransferase n=1 Tax=Amycolatopsis nigrescens TaxID=381445 RepID=UPI00037C7CFB|nr:GNAT family N-acetyltransferase [Amycolatopsis nigrescens]
MLIREAEPADWPGIWPFWRRIAADGETIAWHRDTTEEQAREIWMSRPPNRLWVAEQDGVIVGSAGQGANYGPASRVASATYLVDPDRHGQGIGRRLVRHTLEQARADGFAAMVFNAVVETNHAAVHLYRSLGFTILATVPDAFPHPRLGPVGLHLMHRLTTS